MDQEIFEALSKKILERRAVVGVFGLGYVGLPLFLRFVGSGFKTIGFDIDADKVKALASGKSYIENIPDSAIVDCVASGASFTSEYLEAAQCDVAIICVPTPLNKFREPDLAYVTNTLDSIKPHLRKGQLISLESTTYPGTTQEEVVPRCESMGLKVGEDLFVVYSPEREDPGNADYSTKTIPKLLGGATSLCSDVGASLYRMVIDTVVVVSSPIVAEMAKLHENIQRSVNIGLANEMKLVADKMGVDIFEVIDAAATKPFGFSAYYPGPGLGGHCIPVDPFYLTWKAREFGVNTRFIELSGEINRAMPMYVVGKAESGLNMQGIAFSRSRILVLGIAYKPNVDDVRESPAVEIMELLRQRGATVAYSDPHVSVFPKMRDHRFDLESEDLTKDNVASFDALILATDHDAFDYEMIAAAASLIVDTRGRYREKNVKIIKA